MDTKASTSANNEPYDRLQCANDTDLGVESRISLLTLETASIGDSPTGPIHGLPFELVAKILGAVVEVWEGSFLDDALRKALFLTCRHWRHVALTAPQIWCNIDMDFRPRRKGTEKTNWSRTGTEKWLNHAGDLPLRIKALSREEESWDISLIPALEALAAQHKRWESLEITGMFAMEAALNSFGAANIAFLSNEASPEGRPEPRTGKDNRPVYEFPLLRRLVFVSRDALNRYPLNLPSIEASNLTTISFFNMAMRCHVYVNLVRGTPNVKSISLVRVQWLSNTGPEATLDYLAQNTIGHPKAQYLAFQCDSPPFSVLTGYPEAPPPPPGTPKVAPIDFFHKLIEKTSCLRKVVAIGNLRQGPQSLWSLEHPMEAYASLGLHTLTVTSLDLHILHLSGVGQTMDAEKVLSGFLPFLRMFVNIEELTLRSNLDRYSSPPLNADGPLREFSRRLFMDLLHIAKLTSVTFISIPLWAGDIHRLAMALNDRAREGDSRYRITMDRISSMVEDRVVGGLADPEQWLSAPVAIIAAERLAVRLRDVTPKVSFSVLDRRRIKEDDYH
jgi:hypothetical protein